MDSIASQQDFPEEGTSTKTPPRNLLIWGSVAIGCGILLWLLAMSWWVYKLWSLHKPNRQPRDVEAQFSTEDLEFQQRVQREQDSNKSQEIRSEVPPSTPTTKDGVKKHVRFSDPNSQHAATVESCNEEEDTQPSPSTSSVKPATKSSKEIPEVDLSDPFADTEEIPGGEEDIPGKPTAAPESPDKLEEIELGRRAGNDEPRDLVKISQTKRLSQIENNET